jgi:hypothetical protein
MRMAIPDNLGEASTAQLLYLALACDSGGDLMTSGLVTVLTDLEVVYAALVADGDERLAGAIHQVQSRLRVLQELARRQADQAQARERVAEGDERARGRPGGRVSRGASG